MIHLEGCADRLIDRQTDLYMDLWTFCKYTHACVLFHVYYINIYILYVCECPIIDGLDGRWLPPPCFPTKVKGILSDEEIRRVEQIHQQHFAWEQRRWRLLEVIQGFVATSEFGELKMVEIGWSSFNML